MVRGLQRYRVQPNFDELDLSDEEIRIRKAKWICMWELYSCRGYEFVNRQLI